MTDRENPEILEEPDVTPAGLRATIDRQTEKLAEQGEEIAEHRAVARKRALEDSKLDGPALKAVTKDLKRGEYDGEVNAEALQKYAQEEYDWEPPADDAENTDDPPKVDDATQARLDSAETRDDLAASSHARGETEEGPEVIQAEVDRQLDEGDTQGAVLTELKSKVARAQ